ncbi:MULTISPECIES: helix-turn-helix domain-containing protein [unclassified Streptomyces]|uniref:helix-turn-helix domain-containing protein n=1 Tax=unclassified Streptomyces TaxID=2593676 RepID=UPI001660F51E|nr:MULTISPECIES: helix-turn-helix transcriptional regulator [unclassified Streptomyces]MBD0712336.1 transcriptional regulator [Streptomyces sp. CBMA291]MBD0716710.1 transcriptional regulator [Streptomyces sp. CBMA370]
MPGAKELDPGDSIEQYLGNKVREARLALGREWTQTLVATKTFSSKSRISEIERGEDPPDRRLAEKLEIVLSLPSGTLTDLVKILTVQNVRDYAQTYMRRQLDATAIHEFSIVVPGLLQTAGYARAAMEAGLAGDATQIGEYVRRRLERQAVLDQPDPPWMVTVLDEACLRRDMGGGQVMREQIEHLVAMCERPNVNIQVLPMKGAPVAGSVSLLTLPKGQRGAYTEGYETGKYTEEPSEVMRFQRVYDLLQQGALGVRASLELMRSIAKEHDD